MFESLDDQIKHDEQEGTTRTRRAIKWIIVTALSVLVFGGLYMGVRLLH